MLTNNMELENKIENSAKNAINEEMFRFAAQFAVAMECWGNGEDPNWDAADMLLTSAWCER